MRKITTDANPSNPYRYIQHGDAVKRNNEYQKSSLDVNTYSRNNLSFRRKYDIGEIIIVSSVDSKQMAWSEHR